MESILTLSVGRYEYLLIFLKCASTKEKKRKKKSKRKKEEKEKEKKR